MSDGDTERHAGRDTDGADGQREENHRRVSAGTAGPRAVALRWGCVCVCVRWGGGGGVDLGPINSGRSLLRPLSSSWLGRQAGNQWAGPITQDAVWISELSTNQRVTESDTAAINLSM